MITRVIMRVVTSVDSTQQRSGSLAEYCGVVVNDSLRAFVDDFLTPECSYYFFISFTLIKKRTQ